MKTAEELNALKEEIETLNKKLAELTDEEVTQISSGYPINPCLMCRAAGEYCKTCFVHHEPKYT